MRSGVFMITASALCALSLNAAAQKPSAPLSPVTPAPSPAAPATPAAPTAEQRELARSAYTEGQALFTEGKYAEAKASFERAYGAVPNPVVLISIAECDARLGNLEDAHATYERYLKDRPDAPDRADVGQKMADLLATPATLVLQSTPSGAAIAVDGQPTGKSTPAELPVQRGDHQVELTLAGYKPASTAVSARIGARHELEIALELEPPKEAAPPAPVPVAKTIEGPPTAALWITGVVGAAGIITGSVLGFLTLAEQSDFDTNPTADSADRGERLALFTDVAFGVGAMALITGAVIYFTSDDAPEPSAQEKAPGASIEFAPTASTRGAGILARGHF